MQKDPNWVLITLAFDDDIAHAKARVADNQLPGIHAHVADYTKNFPRTTWARRRRFALSAPTVRCSAATCTDQPRKRRRQDHVRKTVTFPPSGCRLVVH